MSASRVLPQILSFAGMLLVATGCNTPAPPAAATPVERGRYLVNAGACNDCHTPKIFTAAGPVEDTTRLLSGHPAAEAVPAVPTGVLSQGRWGALASSGFTAWAGPWGVSYAANLTPDATGLAGWTPEMFIQTIRDGKHAGVGRPLLPPMPWPMYRRLSDEDLGAIFAYLQTLPKIENRVPAPTPPGTL